MKRPNAEYLSKTKEYVEEYYLEHKCPPSIRELVEYLDVGSTSTAHLYLKELAERGELERSLGGSNSRAFTPVFTDEYLSRFIERCRRDR